MQVIKTQRNCVVRKVNKGWSRANGEVGEEGVTMKRRE